MRSVSLSSEGFENVTLWENGLVELPNGRKIEVPYATGQVSLPMAKGFGSKSVSLARLVAKYFLDNPEGHTQIGFKNGNKLDCNYQNLEWVPKRLRSTRQQMTVRRGAVIALYVAGKSREEIIAETGINLNDLNQLIHEFEVDIQNAP